MSKTTDEENSNKINIEPQNSGEIFILDENRKINKKKNKNIKINDDKNKTINNGMIININNNYFQLKDSKKVLNNIIKRVKSKEEKKKEKSKDNKISKEKKYKIFGEKRTYTAYNTQNNHKENKKFLINEIQSPKIKKINYQGTEKKKNISSTHYILTMNNNNKDNNSNIYRNKNGLNDKKNSKKLIQSKALFTSQNINNTLTFENRNFSFIEANNDIMSSINSISNNINEKKDKNDNYVGVKGDIHPYGLIDKYSEKAKEIKKIKKNKNI